MFECLLWEYQTRREQNVASTIFKMESLKRNTGHKHTAQRYMGWLQPKIGKWPLRQVSPNSHTANRVEGID